MSDQKENTITPSREMAERCTDFGEKLAILCEQYAIAEGLNVAEFVLSMPAMVSKVISRSTKHQPQAITIAARDICDLIGQFCEIAESERRKEWH